MWGPCLEEPLASRARHVVSELASALAEEGEGLESPSYSSGHSGIALFFAYLAAATRDEQAAQRADAAMDRALEAAGAQEVPTLSLFSGLSGVAWTYRHVNRLFTGEEHPDLTEEVDAVLAEAVRKSPWPWEYDLIFGLAGMGVYALDHPDRTFSTEVAGQIVARLEELAVPFDTGLAWLSRPEHALPEYQESHPEGRYDLGAAHGISGVIGFLACCCRAGVERDRAGRLLQGAVEWLLAHKRPDDGGSTFSAFRDTLPEGCRSAWCYGDPGICLPLLSAARALGNSAWEREAIAVARKDCRRPPAGCGVLDAQLCHGAAGLGHVYGRMHQATGKEEFRRAAATWFERALDMRRPGQGLAGYLTWQRAAQWTPVPGLLSGAAGIGLGLLGAISDLEPDWDRPFLLGSGF